MFCFFFHVNFWFQIYRVLIFLEDFEINSRFRWRVYLMALLQMQIYRWCILWNMFEYGACGLLNLYIYSGILCRLFRIYSSSRDTPHSSSRIFPWSRIVVCVCFWGSFLGYRIFYIVLHLTFRFSKFYLFYCRSGQRCVEN